MLQLLARLESREALIGIFGLGYVGLPLVLRFAQVGYRVIGFDIDSTKVDKLNSGETYIEHITADAICTALDKGFTPTTDFSRAHECDALILCVPTPLDKHREPDLSFVLNTTESIVPHLRPEQIIALESTTWPGTTDEELRPRVERNGLRVGQDIFLVFSPEREDPGNANYGTQNIPKILGGVTASCTQVGRVLYSQVIDQVVPVRSARAAEMTKLLENIHRAVNIGLVNELKIVCDRMDIDIHEVIDAASTKPFGFTPYYPGPGLGGHCIPIDPFYLTWKAREYGLSTRFIELAGEVNANMPQWVVGKISDALNERGQAVKGANILVLGIAYKKNVDDVRESPAVEMMELLRHRGALVSYSDPHVPRFPEMRDYRFDLNSIPLNANTLAVADCVLLATDHARFDYDLIKAHARLIVDSRGVYREPASHIVKA